MLSEANSGKPGSLVDVAERKKKPMRGAIGQLLRKKAKSQVEGGPLKTDQDEHGLVDRESSKARDMTEDQDAADIKLYGARGATNQ